MARLDVVEKFHGISFSGHLHTQESLENALNFQFLDSDILIATYPKSGMSHIKELNHKRRETTSTLEQN